MYDDWKELIAEEMQRDLDAVMDEIESDPAMKDIEAPKDMYDNVLAMIDEHEKQKIYEQLSDEDKELIQLGKVYKKQRKWNRALVLIAAVVVVLAIGTVSMGDGGNILRFFSQILNGEEQTFSDSGTTELVYFVGEEDTYAQIQDTYGFSPVKMEYLPQNIVFHEAVLGTDMQGINIYYGTDDETNIVYIIKPNYRDTSLGTVVEDEKEQEYVMSVDDVEIIIKEYKIVETGKSRWTASFVYQNVQYLIRITNMEQGEVEKIIKDLCFVK